MQVTVLEDQIDGQAGRLAEMERSLTERQVGVGGGEGEEEDGQEDE